MKMPYQMQLPFFFVLGNAGSSLCTEGTELPLQNNKQVNKLSLCWTHTRLPQSAIGKSSNSTFDRKDSCKHESK